MRAVVCWLLGLQVAAGAAAFAAAPGYSVVSGRDSTLLRSVDGQSFKPVSAPANGYFFGVVSDNSNAFVAVGSKGLVLRSTDGGARWEVVPSGTEEQLMSVAWDDHDRFVAVGSEGVVVFSTDGGASWTAGTSGVEENLLHVVTDRAGTWIASGVGGLLLRSIDGGATWVAAPGVESSHLNAVTVTGAGSFVAVGKGTVVRSDDGGNSWTRYELGTRTMLEGVAAVDGAVVAVGWYGEIFRSVDDGVTWTPVAAGTDQRLLAVVGAADGSLLAVGFRGTVMGSDNAGSSWRILPSESTRGLESVALNRLPNLTVAGVALDASCHPVVTLANQGEGPVPLDAWDSPAEMLTVALAGGATASATLAALDPDQQLRRRAEPVTYRFDLAVPEGTSSVAITLNRNATLVETTTTDNDVESELTCEATSGP